VSRRQISSHDKQRDPPGISRTGVFQYSSTFTSAWLVERGRGLRSDKLGSQIPPGVGAKRIDLLCEAITSLTRWSQWLAADPSPESGSRLRNTVPGPSVDSSRSPPSSTPPHFHGARALRRVCTVTCRIVDGDVRNHRPHLPLG
jgi:hypothetical protein